MKMAGEESGTIWSCLVGFHQTILLWKLDELAGTMASQGATLQHLGAMIFL